MVGPEGEIFQQVVEIVIAEDFSGGEGDLRENGLDVHRRGVGGQVVVLEGSVGVFFPPEVR